MHVHGSPWILACAFKVRWTLESRARKKENSPTEPWILDEFVMEEAAEGMYRVSKFLISESFTWERIGLTDSVSAISEPSSLHPSPFTIWGISLVVRP